MTSKQQRPAEQEASQSNGAPAAAAGDAPAAAAASADHGAPAASAPWHNTSLQQLRAALQRFADERNWHQYHTPRNLLLALTGEVGELAEIFQWRGDGACGCGLPGFSEADRQHVAEELSDVLLYLVRLADTCGIDLGAAALEKMEKNAKKYPVHLAHGSAAKYTQLAQQAGQAERVQQVEQAGDALQQRQRQREAGDGPAGQPAAAAGSS
ncbi:hypothetical protein ABPG75_009422 [Micractinium tetrahymenae]